MSIETSTSISRGKNWQLSQFYFFYFASLGALVPFWSLYLDSLGFSALQIGQIVSTLAISKIVAPYLWGWIADHLGVHVRIVKITSFLAWACFLPILWVEDFSLMIWLMLLFSFFWNASLPQFEVVTLGHLGEKSHDYSRIRLWGSLGFIVSVALLGVIFEWVPISVLPIVIVVIFIAIWLSSTIVPEYRSHEARAPRISKVLKQPVVWAFLLSCFFMQASHGPYYTFYSLFMEELSYSRWHIGLFWSLGVLAEVVLMVFMARLLKKNQPVSGSVSPLL